MSESKRVREHYIRPPIVEIETDWQKKTYGMQFHVERYIWLTESTPEYRVAIPENLNFDGSHKWSSTIETRFITYVPTGRIVYDNTKPPKPEPIVYEYKLQHAGTALAKQGDE